MIRVFIKPPKRKLTQHNKRVMKRLCLEIEIGLLLTQVQVGCLVNKEFGVAKKQREREVAEPKRVAATVKNNRFYNLDICTQLKIENVQFFNLQMSGIGNDLKQSTPTGCGFKSSPV